MFDSLCVLETYLLGRTKLTYLQVKHDRETSYSLESAFSGLIFLVGFNVILIHMCQVN